MIATCYASYGVATGAPTKEWPLIGRAIQKMLGVRFSEGYSTYGGKTSSHGSVATVERRALQRELDALTFLERPQSPFDSHDWTSCFTICRHPSDVVFVGLRQRVKMIDFVRSAVMATAQLGKPIYGIGYARPMDLSPQGFAFGLNHTVGSATIANEEAERNTLWFDDITAGRLPARKRYLQGYLRDVFPVNLLSHIHAGILVEGVPLLRAVPCIGETNEFSNNVVEWVVHENEIPTVRSKLARSGVLLTRSSPRTFEHR